mgnify:CR=1 FL=1
MKVTIIGGGISGLYACLELATHGYTVDVYEQHATFGGRIKTKYDKTHKHVLYETGPWRIHPSHHRVLKLIQRMNLKVETVSLQPHWKNFPKKQPQIRNVPNMSELSLTVYQDLCRKQSLDAVNTDMQKTGYDMILQEAYRPRHPFIENDEKYFVVQDGFTSLVEAIVHKLESMPNVHLYSNHRITEILRKKSMYEIKLEKRTGHNDYESKKTNASCIFLALPPTDLEKLTSLSLHPNISSVGSFPLLHTYARSSKMGKEFGKYICNSPISQIISTCFQNNWFQISYTGGRLAMMFHNLYLSSKKKWNHYIRHEFYKYFPKSISIEEIQPHFWRHAIHYWHPNFKTTASKLSVKNIQPHPQKYPNLYIIGESISTIQGWIEGALETTDIALSLLKQKNQPLLKFPKEYVIYDKRVLDVEEWKMVHPGSREAIENHMGEDITNLWNEFHPHSASKYLLSLEVRR